MNRFKLALVVFVLAAARYSCAVDLLRPVKAMAAPIRCVGCERNEGKIKRNRAERDAFVRANPRPKECVNAKPACVVDHIIMLACSLTAEDQRRLDNRVNMQWQTAKAGKAKDAWERELCMVTAAERVRIAKSHGQRLPPGLEAIATVKGR